MSLRDDLVAAKALIDTPEKWCKGTAYRVIRGYNGTSASEPPFNNGYRMCAGTACDSGGWRSFGRARLVVRDQVPRPFNSIEQYNDAPATTHADIMALFDRAIKSAEPQGTP